MGGVGIFPAAALFILSRQRELNFAKIFLIATLGAVKIHHFIPLFILLSVSRFGPRKGGIYFLWLTASLLAIGTMIYLVSDSWYFFFAQDKSVATISHQGFTAGLGGVIFNIWPSPLHRNLFCLVLQVIALSLGVLFLSYVRDIRFRPFLGWCFAALVLVLSPYVWTHDYIMLWVFIPVLERVSAEMKMRPLIILIFLIQVIIILNSVLPTTFPVLPSWPTAYVASYLILTSWLFYIYVRGTRHPGQSAQSHLVD